MASAAALIEQESIKCLIANVKQLQMRCATLENDNKGLNQQLAAIEKQEAFQLVPHDQASGKQSTLIQGTGADMKRRARRRARHWRSCFNPGAR